MKILLSIILTLVLNYSISQTVIAYDYMETWTWSGYWAGASATSTWANNASVTTNTSAVIYGLGSGSSTIEQDWYVLPNITGLDPNKLYQFRFRLASYRFSSTNTTRGVDSGDFVQILISTNGEISYTSELRITGFANAYWDYNTNGIITHTANGIFNTALNTSGGDVYRSGAGNQQTVGYSVISLDLPLNINQIAVDILCRVNSAGEEWWLDNIELVEIDAMPVELMNFDVKLVDDSKALIEWSTASENNCDYFIVEKSNDGIYWDFLVKINGHGNSTEKIDYRIVDNTLKYGLTYYRLTQIDYDGNYEVFNNMIRVVDKLSNRDVIKITNTLGQTIDEYYEGIIIIYYDDNTFEKKYNKKVD
jgi:hypothetical protein